VRYLTLAEAPVIAEAVTGTDPNMLAKSGRIDLLDSALYAPQASFGGQEFYPRFIEKAAVLAVRIIRNHPLPDGNKRLGWGCLNMFCGINGYHLEVTVDGAVEQMIAVAAGQIDEASMTAWFSERLRMS
jgi:death on curing protein